jgi:hypothetical protein
MIECPVDFSKLRSGTEAAIEALAQAADMAFCIHSGGRLPEEPLQAAVYAKDSKIPLAVFYAEAEPDDEGEIGIGMTLLDINEDELYRKGRTPEVKVDVRNISISS